MSLYNQLFGINKHAAELLGMLGLSTVKIPRFRDIYLKGGRIIIYTRTGGPNRPYFDSPDKRIIDSPDADMTGPYNSDLRAIKFFIQDYDDDLDSTFAHFEFDVPGEFKTFIHEIPTSDSDIPRNKWLSQRTDMETMSREELEKKYPAIKEIAKKIKRAIDGGGGSLIEI